MSDISAVKALVFDVFGTVVDWRGSIIRERRFAADYSRGGPKFPDCNGGPREQPPAADGREHRVQIGNVFHQFERRRSLSRDNSVVVVRVDQRRAGLAN